MGQDKSRDQTDASPALVTTKSLLSGSGEPGSLLTYRISVSNVGNQAASSVTLTETVPDHTTFEAGSSSAGWSCSPGPAAGSTCTVSLGSLAGGGASASRDFAVRIVDPLPAGVTAIANQACSSAPSASQNCDDETIPTTGSPVLEISKRLLTDPGGRRPDDHAARGSGHADPSHPNSRHDRATMTLVALYQEYMADFRENRGAKRSPRTIDAYEALWRVHGASLACWHWRF